jgi:hypothetical protein
LRPFAQQYAETNRRAADKYSFTLAMLSFRTQFLEWRPDVTSISSASFQQFSSPRQLLQNELSSEVTAGAISSADSDALSSALDDIDSTMQSDSASRSAASGPPAPGEMKQKIDDLIASEVKSGKLTDGQAGELKNVFAKAFQHGGPGGPGGGGGGGAASASDGSNTQTSSGDDTTTKLLEDFINMLRDAQDTNGYSASGDLQSKLKSLLVDYQT